MYRFKCMKDNTVLRQKFVALSMCIRRGKRSEIHDLSFHPKKLGRED